MVQVFKKGGKKTEYFGEIIKDDKTCFKIHSIEIEFKKSKFEYKTVK